MKIPTGKTRNYAPGYFAGLNADDIMPGAYAAASSGTNAPNVDTRSLLTKVSDWFYDSSIVRAYTASKQWTVDEAKSAINELYRVGLEFQSVYSDLSGLSGAVGESGSTELQQNYADVVSRGNILHTVISDAVSSVTTIANWVKSTLGVDLGNDPQPPGLGFLPLAVVPLAIIGGVVACIALATAWIVDARSAIAKIQAVQALVADLPPEQQAAAIKQALEQTGGLTGRVSSIVSGTTGLLVVGGLIAAGYYFRNDLKRMLR